MIATIATISLSVCACTVRPTTCRVDSGCRAGESCVLGGCVPQGGASPVVPTARRYVLEPASIAFVASGGEGGSRGHRPLAAIPLGARLGSEGRILVRFEKGAWERGAVARAYLVLERLEGAASGPGAVVLRAARVFEPWSPTDGKGTTWASPPYAERIPRAEAIVTPFGAREVRIDVTPYAADLGRKGAEGWGLRVEGESGEDGGYGAPIATGVGETPGPRLEVYVQ